MDLVITQSMIKQNISTNPSYQNDKAPSIKKKSGASNGAGGAYDGQQHMQHNDPINVNESDEVKRQSAIESLVAQANDKLKHYINNENLKKPHPVVVQLYLVFLRVGEIDNVKERFQADAYFEASWQDDEVNPNAAFDPRRYWEPELFIENSVGNLKQDIKYKVERKDNKTIVHEMRVIKGIFWERLELWDFPLDIQDLSITITSTRDKSEVTFEHSPSNESAINTEDFQQQQEWNLYSHINISQKFIYDVWNNHDRPCFTVSSQIARRPGYFIYNAYMLIFLISVLGFVPFSFSYTAPHFRIQTTCLLILSSVNFRWIVTQKLPTVSYLTTLDKYAIGALIFLVLLCCWHAIIGSDLFNGITSAASIDQYATMVIGALYVLFHLIYIVYFLVKYSRYAKVGKEEPDSTDGVGGGGGGGDDAALMKKNDDGANEAVAKRAYAVNSTSGNTGSSKPALPTLLHSSDAYFSEKERNVNETLAKSVAVSYIKPTLKSLTVKPSELSLVAAANETSSGSSTIKYRNLAESSSTGSNIGIGGNGNSGGGAAYATNSMMRNNSRIERKPAAAAAADEFKRLNEFNAGNSMSIATAVGSNVSVNGSKPASK